MGLQRVSKMCSSVRRVQKALKQNKSLTTEGSSLPAPRCSMRRLHIVNKKETMLKAEGSSSNKERGISLVEHPMVGVTLEQVSQIKNQLREELRSELREMAKHEHKVASANLHAGVRHPYDMAANVLPDRLAPLTILVTKALERQR